MRSDYHDALYAEVTNSESAYPTNTHTHTQVSSLRPVAEHEDAKENKACIL